MRLPSRSICTATLEAFLPQVRQTDLTGFLSISFTVWTRSLAFLVGRAIALLRVDKAASGDRISTDTIWNEPTRMSKDNPIVYVLNDDYRVREALTSLLSSWGFA